VGIIYNSFTIINHIFEQIGKKFDVAPSSCHCYNQDITLWKKHTKIAKGVPKLARWKKN
jgi:hypothetical protein